MHLVKVKLHTSDLKITKFKYKNIIKAFIGYNYAGTVHHFFFLISVLNQPWFSFLDKADNVGAWTKNVESGNLQSLFGSFRINIPEEPYKLSFANHILEESNLAKFVEEIRILGRSVVLHKYLRNEETRPGTVYVFDVNAKYTGNQVVIEMKVIYTT